MSHTPGSWEWDGTSLVAREPIEDDMGPRWVVRCVSRPSTDDARLIAAAPEMLALLRELAEEDSDVYDIRTTARALLKRLEGV